MKHKPNPYLMDANNPELTKEDFARLRPAYLTTTQAGQAAGLSHQRIRALCGKRLIPGAIKVGKSWIIPIGFTITRNGSRGPKSTITGSQS